MPWLLDRSSLTARVLRACDGGFRVELLGQWRGRPLPGEAQFLGIPVGRHALIREVRLCCDRERWVYARSVIPLATLHGAGRKLGNLGTRPLGAVLFADRRVRRTAVELARVQPGELIHRHALQGLPESRDPIWGRRSLFRIAAAPLLVSEWFLPGLPRFPGGKR
ncbi:MAG: chorismate lyase [Gammaproteobacteria bacterium]|nr:chorismate lyase [Gammaproteobacteria bacterium]MCP5137631.1 chorismate lyase [Gammaproteobacteria bacterium]